MNGIYGYQPKTVAERSDYERFRALLEEDADSALGRGEKGHLAATALVFDRTGEKLLLVKHKIFGAYCAPGGHADGETEHLMTAIRETKEETGVDAVPYLTDPALFVKLPVKPHIRRGEAVEAHVHYVFVYLLTALKEHTKQNDDETDGVLFAPVSDLEAYVTEPYILEYHRKAIEVCRAEQKRRAEVLKELPELLLPWFRRAARDLPWRKNRTPYRVWLSEIMLQQTRVEAVKEYYLRFLKKAPEVEVLAKLDDEELSKLWEGLGYYTRMRNLKKTAKLVAETMGGEFPKTAEGLKKLPGIGDYTAGAIASIAFGEASPAVDGNVVRVLSRVLGDYRSADAEQYKKELAEALREVYPKGSEGDFTESLMELGATVCLPNGEPLCALCPLEKRCAALSRGEIGSLPVLKPKAERKTVETTVFLIKDRAGRYAVRKRVGKGVLEGMWEFPNLIGRLSEEEALKRLKQEGFGNVEWTNSFQDRHIFTHLTWEMTVYEGETENFPDGITGAADRELAEKYAVPTAFKKLLKKRADREK